MPPACMKIHAVILDLAHGHLSLIFSIARSSQPNVFQWDFLILIWSRACLGEQAMYSNVGGVCDDLGEKAHERPVA
jgi:hypothetical protein